MASVRRLWLVLTVLLQHSTFIAASCETQWDSDAAYELYFTAGDHCADPATATSVRIHELDGCSRTSEMTSTKVLCEAGVPTVIDFNSSDCSGAGQSRPNPDLCQKRRRVQCNRPTDLQGRWFVRVEGFQVDSNGDAVNCIAASFRLASRSGECVEKLTESGQYERVTCGSTGFESEVYCDKTCKHCRDIRSHRQYFACPFRDRKKSPIPPPVSAVCGSWDLVSSMRTGIAKPHQFPGCGCLADTPKQCSCGVDVTERVRQECDGRTKCTLTASNAALGGDPCGGENKYLVVQYKCRGSERLRITTVCEEASEGRYDYPGRLDQTADIGCCQNRSIQVEAAEYGRRTCAGNLCFSPNDANCASLYCSQTETPACNLQEHEPDCFEKSEQHACAHIVTGRLATYAYLEQTDAPLP